MAPPRARGRSEAYPRSRSATWHTCPCQSALSGLSPFQVCTFLGRPGTPTPAKALSVASHRSRSAQFLQTWHTYPCQSAFHGPSPFQVCAVLSDLERPPLSERSQWPLTVPGLRSFDRPGTPAPVRALSVAPHRSRSARF